MLGAAACLAWALAFSRATDASAGDPEVLEEVIVTARKTEEDVQDIPMSVQVLPAELLDVTDTTHFFDLQYSIPGLVVNNLGHNGAGFSLRGISDQGGSSLSVATHIDGVYFGSSILSLARLFDLERIEVLKGPQGTLYGRNATGGTLNLVTRRAEPEFSAGFEVATGSFATTYAKGHLNVPLGGVALRMSAIASGGDGYIRNSVDDRRFAEKDFHGLRASLSVPVSDRVQVDVTAQHSEDDGAAGELWLPRPDFLANPADIRLTTVTLPNPFLETTTDYVTLNVASDFGPATLYAVTGYAQNAVRNIDDCAGIPVLNGCVRSLLPGKHRQWSQELRLAWQAGERVDWQAGVYVYDERASRTYFQFTPVTNPVPTFDHYASSDEVTYAAFGHGVWRITDDWRLSGGLRVNAERHSLSISGTGADDSPTPVGGNRRFNNESWRLDLDYRFRDNLLAYAGVSTGFKSGGFTVDKDGVVDDFDAEHLVAWEIGIKSGWPARRATLNASGFYYDFRDLQVNTWTVTDDELIFETDNAAQAEADGMDVEGTFNFRDSLSISAAAVWLPGREFVSYRNDRTGDTLSGNDLTRAPEWTATFAVENELGLRQFGTASLRVEYAYRSGYFYSTDNDRRFAQDSFGLVNLFLRYRPSSERWYAFASGRNLGDEDYFNQVLLQASPGYPDTWEAGFGMYF